MHDKWKYIMAWMHNKVIAIERYPRLLWMSIFYLISAGTVSFFYPRLLSYIVHINVMGNQPFYNLVDENIRLLLWGELIIPLIILLWGYLDVAESYRKLECYRKN